MSESDEIKILGTGNFLRLLKRGRWEYVERNNAAGAVLILAVTEDHKIVLVEQFRIPLGRPVIEMPAGLIGDTPREVDDDVTLAARRELLEETGYEARQVTVLTRGPTSSGLTTEIATIVGARGLTKVAAGGGVGPEDITVHEIPLIEVHEWLRRRMSEGVLVDPKLFAGLYFAERM